MSKQKVILIIMDGWGVYPTWGGNAISLADTKNIDRLIEKYSYTTLKASGQAVGLPFHEPGNSEVGHLNIGSGQIVYQGLPAINQMIVDGDFFENQTLKDMMTYVGSEAGRSLHLIGLVSDGGIHSHISHLYSLLELAKKSELRNVYIHFITDGRDALPTSGYKYLEQTEKKIKELGIGKISTLGGRYFAMDRDNHWDRVQKAYEAMVCCKGNKSKTAQAAISKSYAEGITDEFITPTVIGNGDPINDGDGIIFFNFRSDRARQLANALAREDFNDFKRGKFPKNLKIATFSSYQDKLPVEVIFESKKVKNSLVSVLTENKHSHLHIAETEKYAHVTYFFNGGIETEFEGEDRIMIQSPKVATYDLTPKMSAYTVLEKAIENIKEHDFTVINFANTDMVGHTGNMDATIIAAETVDDCVGQLVEKFRDNFKIFITADHGNAEEMINPVTGLPDTEHTINSVPFIYVTNNEKKQVRLRADGRLSDIAPTVLFLLGLEKPKEMVGHSLIESK